MQTNHRRKGVWAIALACAAGASTAGAAESYSTPRTSWGDPDLHGIYSTDDETGTPMERPKDSAPQRASAAVKMIERFARTAADTVEWTVTFEDPATWTRPWTYSMPLTQVDYTQQIYEYACHEGNLAMRHILSGARAAEAAAGAPPAKPSAPTAQD